MLSLSIVAACIIGCNYAVFCPQGTFKVRAARSGNSPCLVSSPTITDIGLCKTSCETTACDGNCQAFAYSARSDRCIFYRSQTPRSSGSRDRNIYCGIAASCPDGTERVAGARGGTQPCQVYGSVSSIGTCKTRCETEACGGNYHCQAFGYSARRDHCYTYRNATPGTSGFPGQILCAATPGEPPQCPNGTTQVGGLPQSGSIPCSGPVAKNSIEDCEDYCNAYSCCQTFSYSDTANKCVAYRYARSGRGTIYGYNQILCRPDLECPAGTSQIGGIGAYFQDAQQVYGRSIGMNIEECSDRCDGHYACTAFAFDYDIATDDVSPTLCREYRALSTDAVSTYSEGPQADQILCAVTSDFRAQSPGLFSIDGMVGYSNGNGQVYVQIPAYVVYGIVALILVNIVCLMVHCWNKSNGNGKDYKTVSMRSDIDEETDIN